jgi:hypothetical protein
MRNNNNRVRAVGADRIATESIGNNRGIANGYGWTRRFVAEMEKLAAPLLR